ncbi:hypothetical protein JCGZ_25720 [Jatropha curcas]|uniref:Uncharacterized protein n=1 Tax=Jatropha curcas TaxID=180498 RepID=A0A067JMJ6_JATCU|nr:uncharacterized protein LOC105646871 [Jatropha curcas]KDP24063.1 hypothetical protein JCGZ_25720 [Jatropha curcas]
MARTNKYTSINYNHVYEKNLTNNATNNPTKQSSSSSPGSYSAISSPNAYKNHLSSSSRTHGRMLVLTRPVTKPVSFVPNSSLSPSPQSPSTQQSQVQTSDQNRSEPESDQISLRPLGRTGAATCVSSPVLLPEREKEVGSPKPSKFVPPHLRPGFVGKEERPGPEVLRGKEASQRLHPPSQQQQQGYFVSSDGCEEGGRPKSGGYERMIRGGESDLGLMPRPRSSGNRPSSSG